MRSKLFTALILLFLSLVISPPVFASSKPVPILLYHYIGGNPNPADKVRDGLSVLPEKFDAQMGYLASAGFTPITFDTFYAGVSNPSLLPAKPIILTFDDGYIDFYLNAYPILKKYNFHAVSFIPTGLVGTSYYMNWDQIKEIDRSGLVSFQAHSVNHPNLNSLGNDQLIYQIVDSKKTLEAQLGKSVNTFAYPYGLTSFRVANAVKNAGFIGAVTTYNGKASGISLYIPRIRVSGAWSVADFAKRI